MTLDLARTRARMAELVNITWRRNQRSAGVSLTSRAKRVRVQTLMPTVDQTSAASYHRRDTAGVDTDCSGHNRRSDTTPEVTDGG